MTINPPESFDDQIKYLKLPFIREHHESLADTAAKENWSHLQYLAALIEGESALRRDRSVQRHPLPAEAGCFRGRRWPVSRPGT